MNKILSPAERRALKARAHPLKPTVMIGNDGLSANVLQEIDSTLKAHELIKIRVDAEDSDEREDMLGLICASTGASAIDHIGKILVVYRERPQSSRDNKGNNNAAPSGGGGRSHRGDNPRGGENARGDNARGGRRSGGQGQATQGQAGSGGQNTGGQRKPGGKKPAGAVWTKVRQAGPNKRRGSRGGPSNNRGAGGNSGGGNSGGNTGGGNTGGGNTSGNGSGSSGGDEV